HQNAVALLDVERDQLAVLGLAARAHGDDFTFLRLLLGGVGDDDAAAHRLLLLDAASQDTVGERSDVHAVPPEYAPQRAPVDEFCVQRARLAAGSREHRTLGNQCSMCDASWNACIKLTPCSVLRAPTAAKPGRLCPGASASCPNDTGVLARIGARRQVGWGAA